MRKPYTIEHIRELVESSPYNHNTHDWWFPGDIVPRETRFRSACKRFYNQGILEGQKSKWTGWRWKYRIPVTHDQKPQP